MIIAPSITEAFLADMNSGFLELEASVYRTLVKLNVRKVFDNSYVKASPYNALIAGDYKPRRICMSA